MVKLLFFTALIVCMQQYAKTELDLATCKMDVIFVLDGSSTIKDHPLHPWGLITGFTQDLAKQINISPDGSHAGLVLFTESILKKIPLTKSESELLDILSTLTTRGGQTNTTKALYQARLFLTDPQYGARQGVPNIVVLVTDGNPDPDELTTNRVFIEAQACRDAGIRVIVVGVGSVNNEIATKLSYQSDDYVHVERFDQLDDVKKIILTEEVCEPVPTTTTTTTTPAPTTTTPEPTTTTPEPTTTTPAPTTTTPEPTTTTPKPTTTTPEPTTTTPEPTTQAPIITTLKPTPEPTTSKPKPKPEPRPFPDLPECNYPHLILF